MNAFTFAGITFPAVIAEFYRSTHNKRTLANGRAIPATMRFAYSHAPQPLASTGARIKSFYLASDGAPDLRWAWCDEVDGASIRHTGWHTDATGDSELMRGVVFRLPHGRGFLAGWSMGEGMASTVCYYVYADEAEAARGANDMAEAAAQDEREYQEAQAQEDEVDAA